MARVVSAYPWEGLEGLTRASVRAARRVRAALAGSLRVDGLESALSELLTAEVSLVVQRIGLGVADPSAIHLAVGEVAVSVQLEPPLAAALLARVLGRPVTVGAGPLSEPLRGSAAAVLAEAARRAHAKEPPRLAPSPRTQGTVLEVTVLLDGRPYSAQVWASLPQPSSPQPTRPLGELGALPVALPLVVAVARAERSELAELAPGDAWLPGAGWWIDSDLRGSGALTPPAAEEGLGVDLEPERGIVLRGDRVRVPADCEEASMDRDQSDVVLDAPLVVRVELATLSLSARDWAALAPGDVIETGRRVAEPVVLRVGGREVARGELVNVEGELGVRIRELIGEGAQP